MSKAFNDMPSELVKHVVAGCGLIGRDWLDKLPETVPGSKPRGGSPQIDTGEFMIIFD